MPRNGCWACEYYKQIKPRTVRQERHLYNGRSPAHDADMSALQTITLSQIPDKG